MKTKKRLKSKKMVLAYVTTKNPKEAHRIGEALIKKRLAACVNIIPGMVSIYRWQGKVESAKESILIVKSGFSQKKALTAEIKRLHSYSIPCILFISIDGGNQDYLAWLSGEV